MPVSAADGAVALLFQYFFSVVKKNKKGGVWCSAYARECGCAVGVVHAGCAARETRRELAVVAYGRIH